jgi:hypothetical protein
MKVFTSFSSLSTTSSIGTQTSHLYWGQGRLDGFHLRSVGCRHMYIVMYLQATNYGPVVRSILAKFETCI